MGKSQIIELSVYIFKEKEEGRREFEWTVQAKQRDYKATRPNSEE